MKEFFFEEKKSKKIKIKKALISNPTFLFYQLVFSKKDSCIWI
jgi:hypothetical protein